MPEYIEREKLLADIEESVVFTVRPDRHSLELRGANAITERIKLAPSADVAEVRHGEWIVEVFPLDMGAKVHCSVCGYFEFKGPAYDGYGIHNFCPNCGAKMDGKEN